MRIRAYLVVLALVAAGLVAARACGPAEQDSIVTPELAGIWTTTFPGYTDRFLEIRPLEIIFGQGEEGEARYPILGVTRTPIPRGGARYLVRYRVDEVTEGAEGDGNVEVIVGRSGLRLASQPRILWTESR